MDVVTLKPETLCCSKESHCPWLTYYWFSILLKESHNSLPRPRQQTKKTNKNRCYFKLQYTKHRINSKISIIQYWYGNTVCKQSEDSKSNREVFAIEIWTVLNIRVIVFSTKFCIIQYWYGNTVCKQSDDSKSNRKDFAIEIWTVLNIRLIVFSTKFCIFYI